MRATKRIVVPAALLAALVLGVGNAAATQSFSASLYRSSSSSCSAGAANTAGARYGAFRISETSGYRTVLASVTVDNLYPDRTYNVSVTEWGRSCLLNANVTSFDTDAGGKAVVHFQFWAHSGETTAWVTIQHGSTGDVVRSTSLPINL